MGIISVIYNEYGVNDLNIFYTNLILHVELIFICSRKMIKMMAHIIVDVVQDNDRWLDLNLRSDSMLKTFRNATITITPRDWQGVMMSWIAM